MSRHLLHIKAFLSVAAVAAAVMFFADPAFAQQAQAKTLGAMTNSLYASLVNLQTFLSLLSYILGIYFSITGMLNLRAHVEDPGRNPLNKVMLRLAAAAFFIFAPTFANLIVNSLGGGSVGAAVQLTFTNGGGSAGNTSGQGLEVMLNRLVKDIAAPILDNLLPFIAYAAGLIFMLVGLKRLALATGDGPQAPGGLGTIGTFFVAAALMSFGYIVYTLEGSIFGTTNIINSPTFTGSASSGNSQMNTHANNAMWGVFIFLRIVGYISVLRALFMLRAAGEGGNVSMMVVGTHLVAGALLANATGFVLAVQESFIDPANHILSSG